MERFHLSSEFVDADSERELLAAMAGEPELYWQLLDLLPTETFVAEVEVWEGLAKVIEAEGRPTVPEGWASSKTPEATAQQLADLYQRRLLAEAQERLSKALFDRTFPAQKLAALLEEEAVRVQAAVRELKVGQAVPLPSLLAGVLESIKERVQAVKEGSPGVGLSTGLPSLDRLLGGLQAGVHLMAAEPGMGKTTLTLQMAAHMASMGEPVLFVSFEETIERLALKAVCQRGGLEMKRYSEGYGDPKVLERAMLQHGPGLQSLYLIEGSGRLTVGHLRAKALSVMSKHKVERCLVVVDYLQRWAASRRDFNDYRHVVSGLVTELRELALRLKSPVLAISSQNRPGQGRAQLTSLKESGDLEYSADTAMFLTGASDRQATAPSRSVDLCVAKNRFGDTGVVELVFRPDIGTMRELSWP